MHDNLLNVTEMVEMNPCNLMTNSLLLKGPMKCKCMLTCVDL